MIAVDTNILVYAHRTDATFHDTARGAIERLAQSKSQWAIPWPCAHEFIAIVTNPRIFKTPTPLAVALDQLRDLSRLSNLSLLAESDGYLEGLEAAAQGARVQGGAIHDARIAALCMFHGVAELWSADRDFSRFPALAVRNPMAG